VINSTVNLKERACNAVGYIQLGLNSDDWQAVLTAAMNFWVPWN